MSTMTALVTGANRGIGFEVCKQLGRHGIDVVLTGREASAVAAAVAELRNDGLEVEVEVLDVASEASVVACAARLEQRGRQVDVLVNNAGVYPAGDLLTSPTPAITEAMAVNFFGAVWTARAWMPGMNRRGHGRIVNVTSGYGSFAEGLEGPATYAISKAALNALTVRLTREARGDVKVNAAFPGWVRTRMGGSGAPKSVQEGADTIVWLATLPADGPSGGFFRKRQAVPWWGRARSFGEDSPPIPDGPRSLAGTPMRADPSLSFRRLPSRRQATLAPLHRGGERVRHEVA